MFIKSIIYSLIISTTIVFSPAFAADIANLDKARAHFEAGKSIKALVLTEQMLNAEPNNTAALFLKAKSQSELGKKKAAINTYQKLIKIEPSRIEAYNNLAAIFAEQGDLKQASQTLEDAIQSDPVFATLFNNLRAIYSNMSQTHYRAALRLKPQKAPVQLAAINTTQGSDLILDGAITTANDNAQNAIKSVMQAKADIPKEKTVLTKVNKQSPDVESTSAVKTEIITAKTSPKTKPKKNNATEVKKSLLTWANAWSNRNADAYIKHYSSDYATAGKTHKEWVAGRRWNFKSRKFIRVNLSNIVIESKGNNYRARFKQAYQSNTFKDLVNKELIFTLKNKQWRIIKETVLQ